MINLIVWALGLGAVWLFAIWYFADNGPVFGPRTSERVTFKAVIQGLLREALEVCDPLICFVRRLVSFWAPRLTNRAMLATIFADFAIVASGQSVWDFIAGHPMLALGIIAMNLLTPLTPAGAPARLPPAPSPNGGLVNNAALS